MSEGEIKGGGQENDMRELEGLSMWILNLSRITTEIVWRIMNDSNPSTKISKELVLEVKVGGREKAAILCLFFGRSNSVLKLLRHTKTGFIHSPYPGFFLPSKGQDVPLLDP